MNAPTAGMKIFRRGGLKVGLLTGAVLSLAACGGSESSGEASSTPSDGAGAATAAAPTDAPLGTGFIMMSEQSQFHLTEATYLEESDCTARVSTLNDAEEYEGCMEVPASAICLQVSEGARESDRWWECFVEEAACELANEGHEMIRETGGYVREVLQGCTETEMASVFASM
jgi:hypothetical protein